MKEKERAATALPLESPFTVQVSATVFAAMRTMLSDLLKRVAESSGEQLDMWLNTADQLLRLLRVNLDRLVTCNVNPEFGGIHLYGGRTPCAPKH